MSALGILSAILLYLVLALGAAICVGKFLRGLGND